MSNYLAKRSWFAGIAVTAVFALGLAGSANAQSVAELQAQIQELFRQITALQGGSGTGTGVGMGMSFTRNLTIGSRGADVTALQNYLIGQGFSIPAGPTGYFGPQTRSALAAFQSANGIAPAAGYFGPITRARIAMMTPTPPSTPGTGTTTPGTNLEGGAGAVENYDLLSEFSNEEVGEDQKDVKVAGIEIQADDNSDLRLTSVRVVFDEGTAKSDFDRYAEDVSLWLDGQEVGRVNADRFTEDNNWTATINLDQDAIIRRGQKADLVLAISGARNIDSANFGDTWKADFRQIRFMDATGSSFTEDPGTDPRTFSFESFAAATGVELRITAGDAGINDPHILNVENNKKTTDVDILSFNLVNRGDSDITIDSLPISFSVGGAANLGDVVSNLSLYEGNERIGSENVTVNGTTSSSTVVFNDLNITVNGGDTNRYTVKADILPLSGALNEGDTISATLGETETDSNNFDAEDQSGNELADADITGSVSSGPHAIFAQGIRLSTVSNNQAVNSNDGPNNDTGTFTIRYRVEAVNDTIYVSNLPAATSSSVTASTVSGNGVLYTVEKAGTPVTTGLSSSVSWRRVTGDPTEVGNNIRLNDGDIVEFELSIARTNSQAGDSGLYRALLRAVGWNTDGSTNYNVYNFNLQDFRTNSIFLD